MRRKHSVTFTTISTLIFSIGTFPVYCRGYQLDKPLESQLKVGSGKRHVCIHQVTRTVATLHTASENASSAIRTNCVPELRCGPHCSVTRVIGSMYIRSVRKVHIFLTLNYMNTTRSIFLLLKIVCTYTVNQQFQTVKVCSNIYIINHP